MGTLAELLDNDDVPPERIRYCSSGKILPAVVLCGMDVGVTGDEAGLGEVDVLRVRSTRGERKE